MQKKTSWRKEDGDGNDLFVVYMLSEFFILPLEQVCLFFSFTGLTFFALYHVAKPCSRLGTKVMVA